MSRAREEMYPAFWDQHFPGYGESLAMVIGRFVGRDLALTPPKDDLAQRVSDAIIWSSSTKIRVYRNTDRDAYARAWSYGLCSADATHYFVRTIGVYQAKNALFGKQPAIMRLKQLIREHVVPSIVSNLRDELGDRNQGALSDALLAPSALVIADKRDAALRYMPLLQLWLDGYRLPGHTGDGHVIVRAA